MTLLCYHCCHSYDTQDLSLPVNYYNNTFETVGHFCSWECMKAFVVYSKDGVKFNKFSLITMMRNKMHLHTAIEAAPPREMLKAFGGTLSIESFRENNEKYTHLPIPMIQLNPLIEKSTNIACVSQENANRVFNDSDKKLQRKKKTTVNALEVAMGLIKQN